MKKIFNLMLILVLTIAVLIPGVSAKTTDDDGSIKITNTIEGKTYKIYKILVLDSYADDNGDGIGESTGYIYKVPTGTEWEDFVRNSSYLTIDDEDYVTWKEGDEVLFAKSALQYAKDHNIAPTVEPQTGNGGEITFSNLSYGYYLIDSSVGVLCGLRTTAKSATVNEKNSVPTVTKEVKENNVFGESNSAYIGETVSFKTTVKVGLGAENYVLYDSMSGGLTFNQTSLTVKLNGTSLVRGTDYTVAFSPETTYTFVITFNNEYVKTLTENAEIIVEYTAVVNEGAVVGAEGNENTATLKYGDNTDTTNTDVDTTKTYTYGFDLVKTDPSDNVINGAEFDLYEDKNGVSRKIYLVYDATKKVYRVLHTGSDNNGTKIQAGKVRIEGLDAGNYYLKETKNPDGYTKLLGKTEFTIEENNLDASMKQDGRYDNGGIRIINTKGNLLPETGGIGTTLFITIGAFLVTLFGVLLVTKYRMSKINN